VTSVRSLPDYLRLHAAVAPDRPALVGPGPGGPSTRMSWAEFDAAVTAAATALQAQGARDGARVLLSLRTGTDMAVLYLGALRAGAVPVPVDPAYTERELSDVRTDSTPVLILDDASGPGLLARAPVGGVDPRADRHGDELAVLLYTSGTGGRVRGAMVSARALLANLDQIGAVVPPVVTDEDVVFVPLPLTHVYGLNGALGSALRAGATTVLADRFDADATLATMAAEGVTVVVGVPAEYAAWLRRDGFVAGFERVRFALSGSATLAVGTVLAYRQAGVALHDGYGLTEASPVVTLDRAGTLGAVGQPLPGVDVELRDEDDEPVEPGDPGRIFVRGANLFSGYWPDGRDGPDAAGWFATGDIGVTDDDGTLRLVGRSDDVVNVNGFNVYPAEVEAVLGAERGVAEIAVVGVQQEDGRQQVHAWVVPVRGTSLEPDDLLASAARSLARFKLPSVVHVVGALPRTVTGKIMKWQLGREAADGGA
jgi:long-chain acyl-CoA synthetase